LELAVDPISEDLLFAFGGINKGLRAWVRSCLADVPGVTTGRAEVMLGLMGKSEPVSIGLLGSAHDLTPRAMTVLIAGLEREGLVRRTVDPTDRRVSLIELTPTGREVASEQLRPARDNAAALFNDMPEKDRRQLLALLTGLSDRLRERGIDVPTRPVP
jgi:DNA-binding MarR family transcriptional regulator